MPLSSPTSDLKQIMTRLRAMTEATDGEYQLRRFEVYGVEVLQVSYDQVQGLWWVREHRQFREFEFDDIDLVAIEIYDVLHDMQLVF
ncbi:YkuJ family protein [Convivina praedatoris]|uniref:DUF1797 family protein n=1 Tax=Convivina praedatoris TaxID=2880963 RepID=A0ABN8H7F5_9LACO|nr:YkuJ family protein [Convivina sp. LMG 32447]CAH1850074.1 hypothetical protein R078138_00062 [Convivina sp. LMG 32447]CAH1851111.1 hypothetical protein LMG032447_00270 [Convivina sp. LMG 32447]CAH1851124.1 hypothetical protein R077815_00268 [Convivina sp. LMG 32447]